LCLLVEVKNDNLDVLLGYGVTDELDSEILVWPVLAGQIVKDGTGITIIFLESLYKHALYKLLWKVLVRCRINFFIDVFLAFFCLLLFLSFSEGFLEFQILLF